MEEFDGAIGIDLGTTYSCVAVFIHDQVDVIPNDQGQRTTPSRVAFHNGQILVGDAAMNLSVRGAKSVIYDSKRMIGRKFTDKEIVNDREIWPFQVVESGRGDGSMQVVVTQGDEELRLTPEEVSAQVLTYLKQCAERHLGKTVRNAVITVPAYFNDAQRERTRVAGQISGFNVLRIVNEPTAAALCYGVGSNVTAPSLETESKTVLVFDFGGGTFDVSIITIDMGTFEVRSTAGHTHLGGQDIDAALVKYLIADCKKKHGKDFSDNGKILAKLRMVAERAKKALSHATQHEIVVEGIIDGDEYSCHLSRAKLEELSAKIFEQCLDICKKAMKDAAMEKGAINEVIMVGGSSRIPKLRDMLQSYFNKAPCCSINPDEAIAIGAAVQASILSRSKDQQSTRTDGVVLMDVMPLSIGVDVDCGKFDVLIPRNTTIPYATLKEYSTVENNQTYVDIDIYEGERPQVKHNHKLGSFGLDGITKAKAGMPSIVVGFKVDANGELSVSAEETTKKIKNELVVKNSERLSSSDVTKMIEQADAMRQADAKATQVMELVNEAVSILSDASDSFSSVPGGAEVPPKTQKCFDAVEAALHWFRTKGTKLDENASLTELESRARKADVLANKAAKKLKKLLKKADKAAKRTRGEDEDSDGSYQTGDSQPDDDSDDDADGLDKKRGRSE